ncbi:endonuclease/exonuclease/phosphatase family protein [Zhouia sp. PK063]|uniref:endonuclease/exonuclease/phosphatase family protein n=1 Tax=Zhouia sp. PK063 TaxID=3373602 RepID=UPI0037B8CEAE
MRKLKQYFLIALTVLITSLGSAQEFRIGSFNLRYDNPRDSLNNWNYRKEVVANLIKFHDFDILGTQEGLQHMLTYLDNHLPEYAYIGVGRDDGKTKGEHSAIFYKKDKFKLLDKGDFWLAQDPTYPHKGWDAVLPRICSWGKFKDKKSGAVFFVFNTHFDHIGVKARSESGKLILSKIEELAKEKPAILTGDFNVDQTSASYKVINSSNELTDAYDIAALLYGAQGSFNGFNINTNSKKRIDHIFVTHDFKVIKHGILTDIYHSDEDAVKGLITHGDFPKELALEIQKARTPSDHYPLLAVLKLK